MGGFALIQSANIRRIREIRVLFPSTCWRGLNNDRSGTRSAHGDFATKVTRGDADVLLEKPRKVVGVGEAQGVRHFLHRQLRDREQRAGVLYLELVEVGDSDRPACAASSASVSVVCRFSARYAKVGARL